LPNGLVMLAWKASVGNSRDKVCSQRLVTQAGTCRHTHGGVRRKGARQISHTVLMTNDDQHHAEEATGTAKAKLTAEQNHVLWCSRTAATLTDNVAAVRKPSQRC
jgi:hypothetical protein